MTSVEDVARRAGVSPITVSRVVNNHANVSPAMRERVQRAVDELNYIPNALARGLRRARSDLVALIITDISSPFFTDVAHGAEDAARVAGLSLVLGNSEEDPEIEAEYLRVMGERRVDGVILVPTNRAADALSRSLPVRIPVVLFDRHAPGVKADVVRCDTRTGTYSLCQHLLALGHRRIAIVGGMPSVETWPERVAGYQAALREAGIPTPSDLVIPGDYNRNGGVEAVRVLLGQRERPHVIIAANAQVALGVLDELLAGGCRVLRMSASQPLMTPFHLRPSCHSSPSWSNPDMQWGRQLSGSSRRDWTQLDAQNSRTRLCSRPRSGLGLRAERHMSAQFDTLCSLFLPCSAHRIIPLYGRKFAREVSHGPPAFEVESLYSLE